MRVLRTLRVVLVSAVVVVGCVALVNRLNDDASTSAPTPSITTTSAPAPDPSSAAPSIVPPVPTPSGVVTTTLRRASSQLRVEKEDRQPYLRRYFGDGWIDADGDCRNTRQEVLARESTVAVAAGCAVTRGRWLSYYDDKTWTKSHQVQIDHLVPLAEAWDSGAFMWNGATRIRYANDLGDRRGLVPTTTALNYAKLADDPQRYVPKVNQCRYIASWMAVKLRWSLSVDEREKAAIDRVVSSCPNAKLTVRRAKIDLLAFAAGTGTPDAGMRLESIAYRGTAERVVVRNTGAVPARLVGWVLRDEVGYGQFRLPVTSVPAGGTLTVISTAGRNRSDPAGNPVLHAGWGDVWNNTGDTAVLIDGRRTVADTCRYRGDDTGRARC